MLLVIFILLLLIGLYTKSSFKDKHHDWIIILFICFFVAMSEDVPDYANYERVYDAISKGVFYLDTGIGWFVICKAASVIGLTYMQTRVVIVFISLLLIRNTCLYFCGESRKQSGYFWSLYLLYPSLINCVQLRFFVAQSIVIWGIRFLTQKTVIGYIKYTLFVLLAFTIHSSTIFYLVFLLVLFLGKIRKLVLWLVTILSFCLYFGKHQVINIASMFINQARIDYYFNSSDPVGRVGLLAYSITLISFYIISKEMYRAAKIKGKAEILNYLDLLVQLCLLIFLILPFTFFDTNFFRVQRIMWILLYIAGAMMRKCDVNCISYHGLCISLKGILSFLALFGFIFYICVFTFNIVEGYLL